MPLLETASQATPNELKSAVLLPDVEKPILNCSFEVEVPVALNPLKSTVRVNTLLLVPAIVVLKGSIAFLEPVPLVPPKAVAPWFVH